MTAEFLKWTSLEPAESQTQQDHLHQNLANCAEVDRQREAIAVFDVMADLALVAAQSVLTESDDDMTSGACFTNNCIEWTHSQEIPSPRLKKTMVLGFCDGNKQNGDDGSPKNG